MEDLMIFQEILFFENDKDLKRLIENDVFAYDGYNPSKFLEHLREFEDDELVLLKDIKTLCYFACNRGTKVQKAGEKMSLEGKRLIESLVKKYKITDKTPKGKDEVTVSRIIGTMPQFNASIMKHSKGRVVGTKPEDLPLAFCFPGAPAIIPSGDEKLFALWLEWAKSFNYVIKQGKDEESVEKYGRIVWNAGYIANKKRVELCEKLLG